MATIPVSSITTKVTDALNGPATKYLDAFATQVQDDCIKLGKMSHMFDFLTKGLGLSRIADGVKGVFQKGLVEALENSPLRKMAEDALAENINKYSRILTQNLLNIIPTKITRTLTDLRAVVFNAVYATITFQNNMALFFTMKIAEETIAALRDKRYTLIALKTSVIKLHNALLLVTGAGPFFSKYLQDLRQALALIDQAEKQLTIVQSNFFVNSIFSGSRFKAAKDLLDEAFNKIMPPTSTHSEHPDNNLLEKLLEGIDLAPSYQQQLTSLLQIPKFALEMLGSYDLYVIKVLRVNTLLTGFLSSIQGLQELTHGRNKDLIITQISNARAGLQDVIGSMGKEINGAADLIYEYKKGFVPSASLTSSKAIEWSVRVKAIWVLLETIEPDAIEAIQISNSALIHYNMAVESLGMLNDRVTPSAILKADAGREEIGNVEGLIIAMAVQSNLAVLGLASTAQNKYDYRSVLALGISLESRLQLSIDQDREVEMILQRFVQQTKPIVEVNKNLGNSIFRLLDDLGMDRAADLLKRGAWGEFFSMTGQTADYIGAAVAGLSLLLKGLQNQGQKECVTFALNKLTAAGTSKKLESERSLRFNYTKAQTKAEKRCNDNQADLQKVQGCAAGIDINELFSKPFKSLQGAFRGVFGGDISDALSGTFGNFGDLATTKIKGMPLDVSSILAKTGGVFGAQKFASMALKESLLFAGKITAPAVDAAKSAISSAQDAASAVQGGISSAQGAIGSALGSVQGAIGDATKSLNDTVKTATGSIGGLGGNITGSGGGLGGVIGKAVDDATSLALGETAGQIQGILAEATVGLKVAKETESESTYLKENLEHVDNPFDKYGKPA